MPQNTVITPDSLRAVGDLAKGVSSLLWPAVALLSVTMFRPEIKKILLSIKKLKWMGNEIELEAQVNRLERAIEAANLEARISPLANAYVAAPTYQDGQNQRDITIGDIQLMKYQNPELALLKLAAIIEAQLRSLNESATDAPSPRKPFVGYVDTLLGRGIISVEVASALKNFWRTRNEVAHLRTDVPSTLVKRAVEAGLSLSSLIGEIVTTRDDVLG